jgi:putative ABC transport system permease protein
MRDLQRELESHLAMEAEEQQESGVPADESRYVARRALGNVTLIAEDVRAVWSVGWWEEVIRDLRYGARAFRKNLGFTAVAVLTLALGIGANTAIFSVIEDVMLRPLPFTAPDQLVRIYSTKDGVPLNPNGSGLHGGPSVMDMRDFAQGNHTLQQMVVYDTWRKNVSFGARQGEPQQAWVGLVPAAYFRILDVQPIMGRLFTERESYIGKYYVAAISAQLWRNQFGGDPAILGKRIRINDEPYTIVAVMPDVIPGWMELKPVQIWTPFGFADARGDIWTEAGRIGRGWYTLGRIKPGVSLQQAQADLATIAAGLAATHPVDRGIGVALEKLSDTRARDLRPILSLLMGAVSLILLIACVNLANLLLARNSARERELAMRAALGAGRGRLVRQLLVETLLLSVIGGALGLLLARGSVTALTRMHPEGLPQLSSLTVDGRVLVFTLAVSLLTALLFGLVPAFTGARLNLVEALKLGSRTTTSGSGAQRMRRALVVTEMAMSLMLLVGAGLLVQSIVHLQRQRLGIRKDHLLTGHFYLPGVRYPDSGAITRFCDHFGDLVRALPGVVEASVTTIYPPTYNWTQMLTIDGHPATRAQDVPTARFGLTDAHYLKTMGIPLIRGRDFSASDTETSSPVALISQELQRSYFPSEDPIGRRVHIGPPEFMHMPPGADITDSADVTIVGVIGDIRNAGLTSPPEPQILVLYSQHPLVNYGFKDIVVRTASSPQTLLPEISRQLRALDADMPLSQVRTMDEVVESETGSQRFTTALLALFAAAGLVLAAVGIYGVVSFLVAQRRQELAVRMALGATRGAALWLVLKQGLAMAATGAAIGLLGAWATQKFVRGILFGISPLDPLTFAGGAILLLAIAAIATLIPGTGVMRLDPAQALRQE